jgi:alpha-beta hydrolase superfamily lysophospholipase
LSDEVRTFADYIELEERLFEELDADVYGKVGTGPEYMLFRYSKGSLADPTVRSPNYNRTFELIPDNPRGNVLLLHGMSDSPYSLHDIGQLLHQRGYRVIGLRLPGHGTAPSGLRSLRWEDMATATRLAIEHLRTTGPDLPLHLFGYSMGAGLALDHALNALEDGALAMPDSLVLISPAIGITPLAALAGSKAAVGKLPGFAGAAYASVIPEFDPYKYNSFSTNAGAQVHKLTQSNTRRVDRIARAGKARALPPMLVFKSTVDATVSNQAVVDRLLGLLPDIGNELVLFDINRAAAISSILVTDPGPFTNRLMKEEMLPFGVTLIANANAETRDVVAHYKPAGSSETTRSDALAMAWPPGVISLSHVALPFAPDDPLYGRYRPDDPNVLFLGQTEIRGERGLLKISTDWLLRLRYNPFYDVLESRTLSWLDEIEANRR